MTPDAVFSLAGSLALTGWGALVVGAVWGRARPAVLLWSGLIVPALLAVAYGVMIWAGRSAFETGGFGSIAEVRALFADDAALTAGWIHYLAFDLFVGAFILRDGAARGLPGLAILPSLPPTFLFGPLGLLLHLLIRIALVHSPTKLHDLVDEKILQAIDSGAISYRPDDSVRSESAQTRPTAGKSAP